jgi:hypothetical protein
MSEESKITTCEACSGAVSTAATRCPHCGHPLGPSLGAKARSAGYRIWQVLAVGACVLTIGAINFGIGGGGGRTGLPRCESDEAKRDAIRMLESIPLLKLTGVTVLQFSAPETLSREADEVRCRARVMLTSSTDEIVAFRYFRRDGRAFVEARITD